MLIQRFRAEWYLPSVQICLGRDSTGRAVPLLRALTCGTEVLFSCQRSLHQVQPVVCRAELTSETVPSSLPHFLL